MSKLLDIRVGFPLFVAALTVLIGWRVILATFRLAWSDDHYTYILLIVPLSATLIYMDWNALRKRTRPGLALGGGFLIAAAIVTAVSFAIKQAAPDSQLALRMLAIVLAWVGGFVLFMGATVARREIIPLALLFGLAPLTKTAMETVVIGLQYSSAWSARMLFELFGVPVFQNGALVSIPGITLDVAPECSSIRSSSLLVVTTIMIAQLLLRSPWRKLVLVAVALPLSIAKNGLRIFSIAMLGTKVDPSFITGPFHHQGGIIFFAIALGIIFALVCLLRRGESAVAPARAPA